MKGLCPVSSHMRWGPSLGPEVPDQGTMQPREGPPGPGPSVPMVQCSPFHPGLHSHLPSRQVPCSVQRGWQARWSQAAPVQPSSQRHVPPTQAPWPPQSAAQISVGRWGEGRGKPGPGGAGVGGEREKTSVERVVVRNKGHTWLPSSAFVSNQIPEAWEANLRGQ